MAHRENIIIGGEVAPSVTQVLSIINKPFLLLWYGKLGTAKCEQIKQEAAETGHLVHEAIEAYFRGEDVPELPQKEAKMFALWKGWALESKFTPVELECHLQSQKYKYHGTTDTVGVFGDDPALLVGDWKTSSSIDDTMGLQLSAYAQAYQEQTGKIVTDGFIVRVDKKENAKVPLEVKRFTDLPRYFNVFLSCLDLWRFMNQKKSKGTL